MWQEIKNIYHLGIAILANIFYGFPSRKLRVIGVTGTDGKTTTASLIYHILDTAGYSASMVTSVGAVINGKDYDVGFHVTTPSSFAIQSFLKKTAESVARGPAAPRLPFLVLETTSHALDQYRVFGIDFEVGVLTNVTHEHLDYHKTYENYVKTKAKLLKMSRFAILNKDDESYRQISNFKFLISKLVAYGMDKSADVNPKVFPFKTNLIGEFNVYNSLAAISACKALGISDEDIRRGLKSFKPPLGREDIVYPTEGSGGADFKVMIDFAHTPNAFEQILMAVKPSIKGRLIHVFGSAGQRDMSKRPLMGKVSSKYADIIILTAEDPRSESVDKIMKEIASGIQNSKFPLRSEASKIQNYNVKLRGNNVALRSSKVKSQDDRNVIFKIPDRQDAISAAIKMARKDDFVLITGKSHEKSMNYGHGEIPWNEYEAVKQGLRRIKD